MKICSNCDEVIFYDERVRQWYHKFDQNYCNEKCENVKQSEHIDMNRRREIVKAVKKIVRELAPVWCERIKLDDNLITDCWFNKDRYDRLAGLLKIEFGIEIRLMEYDEAWETVRRIVDYVERLIEKNKVEWPFQESVDYDFMEELKTL